jgi:hypothetical protein
MLPTRAGATNDVTRHRKHNPVEIVRDENGDPLRTFDLKYKSFNWSGYILPNFQTNEHYIAAQATWVVPEVTFKGKGTVRYSSSWIGIGGFCTNKSCSHEDTSLIQLGTEQDAISDTETDYYAWYEMLPEASIPISTITVEPGDTITAALSCADSCDSGQWTLSMTDETTSVNWTEDFSYSSPNLSVEVIEEAPYSGGILPLADFHKASFTATMANSTSADLSKGSSIVMVDKQKHHESASSNVSALDSTHDGFDACFNSSKSLAHCPKP